MESPLERIATALEHITGQMAPAVDCEFLARQIIGELLRDFHAQHFTEIDVYLSTVGRGLVEKRLRALFQQGC